MNARSPKRYLADKLEKDVLFVCLCTNTKNVSMMIMCLCTNTKTVSMMIMHELQQHSPAEIFGAKVVREDEDQTQNDLGWIATVCPSGFVSAAFA